MQTILLCYYFDRITLKQVYTCKELGIYGNLWMSTPLEIFFSQCLTSGDYTSANIVQNKKITQKEYKVD